ncbi:ubiquitinyl hydrolase 1 [Ranunculus cassubicifolius]
MPIPELFDESKGYVVDGRCIIEVEIQVHKEVDFKSYDSKTETGFVGLKNQGATCYMNSLLQTLYHIPCFRKAVYDMPTTEDGAGMPLALQTLFYNLQCKDHSVGTKALTKSFGWTTFDSFMQHDVQELNRILCEKLENKMKGTVVDGKIQALFQGHHMNYLECIDVDYKSTRKEAFYDIQLDVKGCRDVYASFDKYVEVERLEGDNKYDAEGHGLQDAKKGVLFVDFPPVLQLQLKRFEYDFTRDAMVKIDDKYEFPLTLDLDRENGKYLSPDSDRGVRNLYTLHSVLVHKSGGSGGHYYVFIRPTLSDQWFKFDDVNVTKEDGKTAVEEQYGGEDSFKFTKCSSAYMLVYIRDSDKDKIICDVDEKDIAEDLRTRLKKEKEEKEERKRAIAEARLYTSITVTRDKDLFEQIGKDVYFDLVDHKKVHSFRVKKEVYIKDFKEEVAREFDVPVEYQRFWLMKEIDNNTCRTYRFITQQEELEYIGNLQGCKGLFLEVPPGFDSGPIALPKKTCEDILLFFKLYDPQMEQIRYVGRLFVKRCGKPTDILLKLNEMAGFSPDEEIDLYEEDCFDPEMNIIRIDKEATFSSSKLVDGDIICFERSMTDESKKKFRHPDVLSFFEYIHNRKSVHFLSLENSEEGFDLELSMKFTYDEIVENVACHLGVDDPTKIQLTSFSFDSYTRKAIFNPIGYRGANDLSDMLHVYNVLYYKVLDIPLPEWENIKLVEVTFKNSTHSIRVSKQDTVGDLINKLKEEVELSNPDADLRLFGVYINKIFHVYCPSAKIEDVNCYYNLHVEEILEEEKNLGPNDHLIDVFHFTMWPMQCFGKPFMFAIREGETLLEIKVRIQKKLQIEDEEFSKWKFASVSCNHPSYLEDSEVVANCLAQRRFSGSSERYCLGLEHSKDTAPKSATAVTQNRRTYDRSLKICN